MRRKSTLGLGMRARDVPKGMRIRALGQEVLLHHLSMWGCGSSCQSTTNHGTASVSLAAAAFQIATPRIATKCGRLYSGTVWGCPLHRGYTSASIVIKDEQASIVTCLDWQAKSQKSRRTVCSSGGELL